KLNGGFSLALVVANQTNERTFKTPEMFIRIKCDVHEWMFTYVSVFSHPFFAVTDQEGNYRFPAGLPRGLYTVAAFHLKAGETTQPISIDSSEIKPVDFTLQVPTRLSRL